VKWQTEYLRLAHHREILTAKMDIPSNLETRAALAAHVARVDAQLRKLMARPLADVCDPWREERELKAHRSKDRERLREAGLWRDDDYAEFVRTRIARTGEQIRECREQQEAAIEGAPA
jgi:hypothetical protein